MTSGSDKAINTALKYVRDGGKIVVFSSIKNDLRRLSLSKQVSIMEKIKQRKDKEEVKKKK